MTKNDKKPRFGVIRAVLLLFALVLGGLFLFGDSLMDLRNDLRRARWGDQCKSSNDPHPCGYWALYTLRYSADYDEMRDAKAKWIELCNGGAGRACGLMGMTGDAGRIVLMDPNEKPELKTQSDEKAQQLCDAGELGACAIVARTKTDFRELNAAAEAGCGKGDLVACWLETTTSQADEEAIAAEEAKLCEGGFEAYCKTEHQCGPTLMNCEFEYERTHYWNEAMYGEKVDHNGLSPLCDGGSAEACFALGLNVTASVKPLTEPVPVRTLDVTMGKACEQGFDIACRVFAARLLDRPLGERPNLDRARELLGTACENGDAISCYQRATVEPNADVAELTPLALAACQAGDFDPCFAYIRLRAAQLEIDPFPFLDAEATHYAYQGCVLGDLPACSIANFVIEAEDMYFSSAPKRYARAASAAKLGCAGGNVDSCIQLLSYAKFENLGLPPHAELETKVCAQVPKACESSY